MNQYSSLRPTLSAAWKCSVTVMIALVLVLLTSHVSLAAEVKITTVPNPQPQVLSWFGRSSGITDDVNGDSIPDFIVSAPQLIPPDGDGRQGVVFVLSGDDLLPLLTLTNPRANGGEFFGDAVLSTAEREGDAVSKIIVGARLQDVAGNATQGEVFVYSSSTGELIQVIDSPNPQEDAWFGASLESAGDVDGDGVSDIWIGAPKQDIDVIEDVGEAYLFSGSTGQVIFVLSDPDPQSGASFGTSLRRVPDLNGDSLSDLVVGAPSPVVGQTENGRAYVFSGKDGAHLFTMGPEASMSSGGLGSAIAVIADINDDSVPDILLGAPAADGPERNQGRAFIYSGLDGTLIQTLEDPTPLESGSFGAALAATGDIDGEGTPDMAIGSPALLSDSAGTINPGEVLLFSGTNGDHFSTLANPNASPGIGASFGFSVSDLGDIDGDGRPDVIVGAPFHNVREGTVERAAQGEVFIFQKLSTDFKGTIRDVTRENVSPNQDSVSFTVSVKNKGTVPSAIPFKVKVHLSEDETFDGKRVDPVVLKWNVQPPLLAGESRVLDHEIQLDDSLHGNFLIVRVDTKDSVAERKEGNNMKVVPIPN